MEKMNDLQDLLKHEIQDLVSAEDQIIEAMPAMIEKASDRKLKDALKQHLKITQQQRKRLDQVQKLLSIGKSNEETGLLKRLFKSKHHCKGMSGIIEEGEKIMSEDIDPDVMDAAIIGAAQKVEHYEICGYGTARAYAEELGMRDVEKLLLQTLNEEYEADVLLTEMAVGRLNREAETAGNQSENGRGSNSGRVSGSNGSGNRVSATKKQSSSGSSASAKSQNKSARSKKSGSSASKSSGKSGAAKKSASKTGTKASSKASSGKRR